MLSRGFAAGGDRPSPTAPMGALPNAGFRIMVPGYAQWTWRQRERGLVLFGSFAMALGTGVFAWGTNLGLAVLVFAFATHVTSAVDVIRQGAFPGFGRWTPFLSSSGGLAAGVYGPLFGVATFLAWPGMNDGATTDGYLVNRWAYRVRDPARGEWVWLRSSPGGELRIGRVIASASDEVEWRGGEPLLVSGSAVSDVSLHGHPGRSSWPPDEFAYTVPDQFILVSLESAPRPGRRSAGLVLVPRDKVVGRAWARLYPIWDRQLLR